MLRSFKIKFIRYLKRVCQIIFFLIGLLPVRKDLVIFESYSGKQYSCNPKAIYEYMESSHYPFNMVWVINKENRAMFSHLKIPFVIKFSFHWFLLMPRARYWITNSRLSSWIPKPRHTIYVQTWHGTPLKKLALDMDEVHIRGTTTEEYKKDFLHEAQKWDILLSPNPYSTKIFKRAFQFDKEIIEVGYPRNDVLSKEYNGSSIVKIKQKLGLPLDKKIILYAPTWRDDQFEKGSAFDLQLDLHLLSDHIKDEYIVLLRLHNFISQDSDVSSFQNFVYDVSKNIDINELYLISDLLVTDYSSVIFDYANLKKPIIFFTYDLVSYRDKIRGFYFDLEAEAPGPIASTTEGVIEAIQNIENGSCSNYEEKYKNFRQTFCHLENGTSSQQVTERIFLAHKAIEKYDNNE